MPQAALAQAIRISYMIYWSVTQRRFCMTHHHCLGRRLCTMFALGRSTVSLQNPFFRAWAQGQIQLIWVPEEKQ